MRIIAIVIAAFFMALARAVAANYPPPQSGVYTIPSFTFADGETLNNLRLHYETFGTPRADAAGHTTNAVLIIQSSPAATASGAI